MNPPAMLQNMSPNLKLGLTAGGSAAVMGILALVFEGHIVFILLLLALAVLAVGVFLLFRLIVKWLAKRKAQPMEQGIAGNISVAPGQVSGAKKLADLDSLRKSFQTGVEKFRAAGKDLYSLPWYVLVGQPGSGKTEAIRHSAIGFPPGLQDQLQGAGGTINMNWWFTNHAIILDTAGRLMFEEVAPGTTSEWEEFLKLLRSNRPNCPINGMLLVIPAESLLRDTADVIAKNAGKIAQQLDLIQRTLGVRFPVFILITKADYLTGFNQFFDDVTDPQLQHQIMGWSNPDALDDPFKMEAVEAHLQEVRRRLIDRRRQLLRDPVNTEDASGRRLDQTDALFAFPDSVVKIGPRLRQYLETIFVAGEWSPKPLFLRGIYFTSSMSDGKTLDADLAQALGIAVDALPASGVWRRDRAYFLKDLFLQKVFREKGLITRASNAMKLQRQRKIAVIGGGFATVLILFTLTWFGFSQFKASIDNQRQYWHNAAVIYSSSNSSFLNIVRRDRHALATPRYKYAGISEKIVSGQNLADFFSQGLSLVRKPISVPLIFRPVAIVGHTVNARRLEAFRTMFDDNVVAPLVAATEAKLLAPPPVPPLASGAVTAQTRALIELISLARAYHQGLVGRTPISDSQHLSDLARFVLSPADYQKFKTYQASNIASTLRSLYASRRQWPPIALHLAKSATFYRAIHIGMIHSIALWNSKVASGNAALGQLMTFKSLLDQFNRHESAVIDWAQSWQFNDSAADGNRAWLKVSRLMQGLANSSLQISRALRRFPRDQTLSAAFNRAAAGLIARRRDALNLLAEKTHWIDALALKKSGMAALAAGALKRKFVPAAQANLIAARSELQSVLASAQSPLGRQAADMRLLDQNDLSAAGPHRQVTLRGRLYRAIANLIAHPASPGSNFAAGTWLSAFNAQVAGVRTMAADDLQQSQKRGILQATIYDRTALRAAMKAMGVVQAHRLAVAIAASLKALYPNSGAIEAAVKKMALAKDAAPPVMPDLPLVPGAGKPFDPMFDPLVGGHLLSAWIAFGHYLRAAPGSMEAAPAIFGARRLETDYQQADPAYQAYRHAYLEYWTGTVTDRLHLPVHSWASYYNSIAAIQTGDLYLNLQRLGRRARVAIDLVPPGAGQKQQVADTLASIAAGISDLNKPAIQRAWRKPVRRWMQLSANPLQARAQLLGEKPISIFRRYVIRAGSTASFAQIYLSSLSVAGLRALAQDAQSRADKILNRLQSTPAFPLFVPANGGKPTVQFSPATIAAFAANLDALPISTRPVSIRTPDSVVNEQLRAMQGQVSYTVFGLTTRQIVAVRQILSAIHGLSGKPLHCKLQVSAKDKTNEANNSAQIIWPYMTVTESGKVLGVVSFRSPAADPLGRIKIPGQGNETLKLKFYESDPNSTPAPAPNHVITLVGPWAPLQLLYLYGGKSTDGKHWQVIVKTHDQFKVLRRLTLSLTFSRPLPKVSQWPRAHAP